VRVAHDDPLAPDVRALLDEHLAEMHRTSPPESVHALDPHALAAPGIVFLTARDDDGSLLGCGAVAMLSAAEAELKSMRTAQEARGRGVATAVLAEAIATARRAGAARLLLETGTEPLFDPAVRLYERHGFVPCAPFAGYTADPHSRYLRLELGEPDPRGEHGVGVRR
jgi:putative acetyltransferase